MMVQCHWLEPPSCPWPPGATTVDRSRGNWRGHAHRTMHAPRAWGRRPPGGFPMSTPDRPKPARLHQVLEGFAGRRVRVVQAEIGEGAKAHIIAYLRRELPRVDALIVSDYENGVINGAIIAAALPLAKKHDRVITVDAHGDLLRFKGITVATPNQDEAAATVRMTLQTDDDVCRAGHPLVCGMQAHG